MVDEEGFAEFGGGDKGPEKMMVFILPSMWRGALILIRMGASGSEDEWSKESKSSYSSGWALWAAAGVEDGMVRKYGAGGA